MDPAERRSPDRIGGWTPKGKDDQELWPGWQFWFRSIPSSVWNWAVDHCWRTDSGEDVFDMRMFWGWILRFATDEVEGPVWKKDEEIPDPQERVRIMTRSYPLLNQEWFDKIPVNLIVKAGQRVAVLNSLGEDEKKTSGSPPSGDGADETTEAGIADSVTRFIDEPTDSISPGKSRST